VAMAEERMHELPVAEIYRQVEIWGLQSPERIARAKAQIGLVIDLGDLEALYLFACDPGNAPEARQLAGNKLYVAREKHRSHGEVDFDRLGAALVGVERITTRLGRLMARRLASATAHPWPDEWRP
jgi:hypothetical protein